jgi:hypothetical protein
LIQLAATNAKAQQAPLASGAADNDMVKEALRIFGGSIKGVRKDNA